MLSKRKRIPRELWSPILGSRRFKNSPHFSLRMADGSQARFGVSVSKKISKSAVVRNRTRRRVYAVIGHTRDIEPGLYLLSAKPGADKIKGEVLRKEVIELLKGSERG